MAVVLTDVNGLRGRKGELSDDQLMEAYRHGDRQAFDKLYGRYRQSLYGYLYRHCGGEQQVAELYQDVWLRVIAASGRYKAKGRFRSWLFTLAHNCLVDYYRRSDQEQLTSLGDEMGEQPESAERETSNAESMNRLSAALVRLPVDQRQAFCLREEQGFSISEIAEIQGISAEAAKSRLRYAYGKLRRFLMGD